MKLKLLVHVNEPERWLIALGNITNFLNDVGDENAIVLVVANGAGVRGYVGEQVKTEVQGEACVLGGAPANLQTMRILSNRGVTFMACSKALEAQGINTGEIPEFVRVIPAGMTEMVKRQMEGFAYIKP
jgi:intracellular sulfur oxidation DsrE/DsrF family protein